MAAAGGDTIVPTNWGGLITIAVIVAVVAAATYFGMEYQFGHQGGEEQKTEDSLSVQDVFSASARREVAAAESARVLSRADLATGTSDTASAASDDEAADSDSDSWDTADSNDATSDAADDDWGASASGNDDWDTTTDDWDAEVSEKMDAAADTAKDTMQAAAKASKDAAAAASDAAKKVAKKAADAAKKTKDKVVAAVTPSSPERKRPGAEALRDWWSDANGDLAVRFAGTLDRGDKVSDGIAVMFSEAVSPAQGNQHMTLIDEDGQAVSGQWKSARNPSMLVIDGLKPGRYELNIGQAISSQNGHSLSKSASGPVFVY